MSNVIDFSAVMMKKNRKNRSEEKKKKLEKKVHWTGHFEERRRERKISRNLIKACLDKGRVEEKEGALHYILENLHVVVDKLDGQTLLTTYFRNEWKQMPMNQEAA